MNPMNPNPYESPRVYGAPPSPPSAGTATRTPFILAAVGAWMASAYWALLTVLIGLGVAFGSGSAISVVFPCILIVLYALRGWQLIKGDASAAQRILFLHIIGCVAAFSQMASGDGIVLLLQSIKVLIHVFGGVAAYFARRAAQQRTV